MSAHEPQAGFTQDEDDQIQILYSFHRLTFYTIQEQHFPDRSVEDVERRFYEVRDARAHLGPQAQNQELQQQREPSFESRNKFPGRDYGIYNPNSGRSGRACDRCYDSRTTLAKSCDKILSGCSSCRNKGKECRYTRAATARTERERKRKNAQEGNFQQGSARHLGSQALQQGQVDDEISYGDSPPASGDQQQAKSPRSMNVGREGTGVGSTSRTNPVAQARPRPGDPVTSAGPSASRPQQHQPQLRNLLPGDDVSSSSSILAMYAPAPSRGPPTPTPPLHQRRPGRGPLTSPPLSNQAQESPSRPASGVAAHETQVSMVELGRALPAASGPESHVMGDNRRGGSGRDTERVRSRGHGRGRGRA
ncbi:hypothetical protein BGZ57DRAFT_982023 [Hyaloscypha finlandica]|nr:hypothetical protein BGZ57DRAFT_982023 [Hyaloscypha finlandica]